MRSSGILMSISSLPSNYGIGTLGEEAYNFVDFLNKSGQRKWQILPIGPTSFGDSPYQSFSSFAGNPYFIDLDILQKNGLLEYSDYKNINWCKDDDSIDYSNMYENRFTVLKKAFKNFTEDDDYAIFIEKNKSWLEDYSLFMSIKNKFDNVSWQQWDNKIKTRDKETLTKFKKELKEEISFWSFLQYHFYKQWYSLKKYANSKDVFIVGDIPIYVALDSADVWVNSEQFDLDKNLSPVNVAGCPPDYFSPTGQLWGNPLYKWDVMKKNNYDWWIKRVAFSADIYDTVRIDHFRAFAGYYTIPFTDKTAEHGTWLEGPGMSLFDEIKKRLGTVDIIAEDLGFITPDVIKLLEDIGFPGMKILQFGFNEERNDDSNLPHNYVKNSVVYTGTHDNSTFLGWVKEASLDALNYAKDYLDVTNESDIVIKGIKTLMASSSNTVIIPLQDYLELDDSARINIPSTTGSNWQWRVLKDSLTDKVSSKILFLTTLYQRFPKKSTKAFKIELPTMDIINAFVHDMAKIDSGCNIVSGDYVVDGTSMLGILSLDLSKTVEVIFNKEIAGIEEILKPYLTF